jgi:hypothetical protein
MMTPELIPALGGGLLFVGGWAAIFVLRARLRSGAMLDASDAIPVGDGAAPADPLGPKGRGPARPVQARQQLADARARRHRRHALLAGHRRS